MLDIESEEEFEEILEENEKVIVDFWAEWCGPCKSIAPHYEDLSEDHEDMIFAKLEVEKVPEVSKEYKVSSIPTFVAFEEEEEVSRNTGSDPSQLDKFVENVFNVEEKDEQSEEE
jgi:thioredoxin 1